MEQIFPRLETLYSMVLIVKQLVVMAQKCGEKKLLFIPAYLLLIRGTERGYGRVMLGGFNSWGYSQIYFANLRAFITNSFSHIKVALSDINGNVVQQLIYSEANGFDVTYTASTKFNINSPNGNYYLMLEVESGATHLGKNATILMNGCYLV